jgi:hypothetical protein
LTDTRVIEIYIIKIKKNEEEEEGRRKRRLYFRDNAIN